MAVTTREEMYLSMRVERRAVLPEECTRAGREGRRVAVREEWAGPKAMIVAAEAGHWP